MATFERIGGEVVWQGKIATVRVDRFRYDDGEEAEREVVDAPRRRRDPRARRRAALPGPPAARGRWASEALLELPAGKLDERARSRSTTAKRELAEEIGKGARSWRPINELLHLARVR